MSPLAKGAVQIPTSHLSVRVPWHDTDWTGRVCRNPVANHSCSVLKNIKENKDSERELEDHEKTWEELDHDRIPPCVVERAGFMRSRPFSYRRTHPYASPNSASHQHFAPTNQRMPAYSLEALPFRWMLREEARTMQKTRGYSIDWDKERRADEIMDWEQDVDWIQDHRNQLAVLDSFFSAIQPERSLVLLYAKDIPLVEEKVPGGRILIGAGRVRKVAPAQEWEYDRDPGDLLRSYLWERSVEHSIRPEFEDGFLLPYQQLIDSDKQQGRDLSEFVAWAPTDHFDEFSFVSELVSDDAAIASLVELARVVDLLPGVVDGPWDRVSTWLGERIAEAWRSRGPYPGLGAALTAIGMEQGALIAHRVVEEMPEGAYLWDELEDAIHHAKSKRGPVAELVGRAAGKAWFHTIRDDASYRLLKLASSFSLTVPQSKRFLDPDQRGNEVTDEDLIENPYRFFEIDRLRMDSVALPTIDRGLFPQDSAARAMLARDPLPEPVTEASDDRRVRATAIQILEDAAGQGHSLLDEASIRGRLPELSLDPPCDPPSRVWKIAAAEFAPLLQEVALAGGAGRGWQLDRLFRSGQLIIDEVERRATAGPIEVNWDWRKAIDRAIGADVEPGDERDEAARAEKTVALEALAGARIAVLVGPAGTGKTTMLQALCAHPDIENRGVLLLAPTGKARVQLAKLSGTTAFTLAQFLRGTRWDLERGYFINPGADRNGSYRTVIVDEASMLTEEMLAALLDSLTSVERLILCGDHRQLPPIGAGRPFADLIRHLRNIGADTEEGPTSGASLAQLRTGMRQGPGGGMKIGSRDDLAVADLIAVESEGGSGDEALSRVLAGEGDGTIEIRSWETEEDLHDKVVASLETDPDLRLERGDADALLRSLGASDENAGRPRFEWGRSCSGAERWQLLSPVRSRLGGVTGLNSLVRLTWRRGHVQAARANYRLPNPMGADEILNGDKVMCVSNQTRPAWNVAKKLELPDRYVANGEMGVVVGWRSHGKGAAAGLKVEFSTQPGLQYTFGDSQLNSEGDDELLEIGYAITIHKAQGSQFDLTFVVVPNPCPLLSAELLYTALTRHRQRVVLFIQGDPASLRDLGGPMRSESARRLTRLFHDPDPFELPEGPLMDTFHVHRTARGELVISKSEVIVANTLNEFGIDYTYELPLKMADGSSRKPDFTIERTGGPPIYWEHLGMLDRAGYRANWEAKRDWYARHGILPIDEGGGDAGVLVCSEEGVSSAGIDSNEIRDQAQAVLDLLAA